LWRWKFEGSFPKSLNKYLIIVAPHTSWIDFPLGLLVKWSQELDTNFIGKDSLFKPPFGFIFRGLGGTPVDRSKNTNLVDSIVIEFNKREKFSLALSPEGTRKKVNKWKTGFYYIAKGANIPIIMLSLDFENRILKISEPYHITQDKEADFKHFEDYFKDIKGCHSHLT
ncbi:MAG: 1-acyl-sn-glycerol-3-phosphate acyltransferase, partial [Flavobacteriaceae bacterium]|nr:1-acyl-sn-glycerol-3-phosphate acyltransferase [Flavobacteriaceae bacterium]